jgi:asparagine synthase (glutamine-hydrolysing)
MCGIAGFFNAGPRSLRAGGPARSRLQPMADAIAHRGPDADGFWSDDDAGIAFAHRRLSILDLSPAGAQPMEDHSGRYVIVLNGEIYNHLELRRRMESQGERSGWFGHSDTETLVNAIACWGLQATLESACGMFAFALWDRSARRLTLVRDRLGEKPLYYGWANQTLLFGSELKAILAYPGCDDRLDREAIAAYLRFSYIPEPATIYRLIRKLQPGHLFSIGTESDAAEPRPYWSLEDVALDGVRQRRREPYVDLCEMVEATLTDVVGSQMLSDVPLGCFLSGGIDSSLVAALMQRTSRNKVRTFSVGFEDKRFDESGYARRVAEHLGTEHTEFIVTENDALSLVPDLPNIYDEPFADTSQIPTALLSRLSRRHVTVALTGDGGDEVFGGYNRYIFAPNVLRYTSVLPEPVRKMAGAALGKLQSTGTKQKSGAYAVASYLGLPITTVDKLSRVGAAISHSSDAKRLYRELVSTFVDPAAIMLGGSEEAAGTCLSNGADQALGAEEWMMAMDSISYLPGDILVKVDRAAMSASLETRAPFLDRRVVELAWRLPLDAKINGRIGKRILRDILYRYVPRELLERPKQGFAIPLDRWLRENLRDWAGSLLSRDQVVATGLFDPDKTEALWRAHQLGKDNLGHQLWTLLMMQAWLLQHRPRSAG